MLPEQDKNNKRQYLLPAFASGGALLCAGIVIIPSQPLGAFSHHMIVHIVTMNVIAPLVAAVLTSAMVTRPVRPGGLWLATGLQMATLWVWHLPAAQRLMDHAGWSGVLMHGSLFAVALAFWVALLRSSPLHRWHGVLALLVTGKLACLLAALLVFSPRSLYSGGDLHHHPAVSLDDQQLAGLLMLTACPLSYVLAGIVMTAQAVGYFQVRAVPHVQST